jgi:hypothetical protein
VDAQIGARCRIGAFTVVGKDVEVGDDSVIGDSVSLHNCSVGSYVVVHPGARIGQVGALLLCCWSHRSSLHSLTPVIAVCRTGLASSWTRADSTPRSRKSCASRCTTTSRSGLSAAAPATPLAGCFSLSLSLSRLHLTRCIHVNRANCTIDRGSWRNTIIGLGCKLDNLVG